MAPVNNSAARRTQDPQRPPAPPAPARSDAPPRRRPTRAPARQHSTPPPPGSSTLRGRLPQPPPRASTTQGSHLPAAAQPTCDWHWLYSATSPYSSAARPWASYTCTASGPRMCCTVQSCRRPCARRRVPQGRRGVTLLKPAQLAALRRLLNTLRRRNPGVGGSARGAPGCPSTRRAAGLGQRAAAAPAATPPRPGPLPHLELIERIKVVAPALGYHAHQPLERAPEHRLGADGAGVGGGGQPEVALLQSLARALHAGGKREGEGLVTESTETSLPPTPLQSRTPWRCCSTSPHSRQYSPPHPQQQYPLTTAAVP